jgi:hypothetical protein
VKNGIPAVTEFPIVHGLLNIALNVRTLASLATPHVCFRDVIAVLTELERKHDLIAWPSALAVCAWLIPRHILGKMGFIAGS